MATAQTDRRRSTKPNRVRLTKRPATTPKAKAATGYVCLVSMKLLGVQRRAGDPISAAEWASLSDRIRSALSNTGRVGLAKDVPRPSEVETKASGTLKQAERKLEQAQKLLADLTRRRVELEKEIDDLKRQRQPLSYAAITGDVQAKAKLERLREQTVAAEVELDDLEAALKQAEKECKERQQALHDADAQRYAAEAARLIDIQGAVCERIQTLLQKQLVPLIREYEQGQMRFAGICGGKGGGQLTSQWRLRSILDRSLGVDTVSSTFRFDNLRELEQKIMRAALQHWRKEREATDAE